MIKNASYPIGIPGRKWGDAEREQWLTMQTVKRSYESDVLSRLRMLGTDFRLELYGALSYDSDRYPLYGLRNATWEQGRPVALITGGVHGYETSGVLGAIRFLETAATDYADDFNLVVAPCISPWAYETINRWNPNAVDPNRSFTLGSAAEESSALMQYVAKLAQAVAAHIDLHETTNTDNTEFRPALAARDNVKHEQWDIPDGFYLVGDIDNPCHDFQRYIINAVGKVTHIAAADANGKIIGEPVTQKGVINYATKELGLCSGFANAQLATTTEVYPDSPLVDDENCIQAQVTAVTSGLDYVRAQLRNR